MMPKRVLAFAAAFVLAAGVFAQQPGEAKARAHGAGKTTPVFDAPGDLKWGDLNPTMAPGVKIADVWGDHTKAGFGAFLTFPPGFLAPLHTHTNAIKIVVISGTYIQTPEGKAEMRMGPGSYVFQPGGGYKHISACDKASECLLFIESTGPFDLKLVEAPKAN
jgi:anti-sigma factor ChrR (cupin superfamily)